MKENLKNNANYIIFFSAFFLFFFHLSNISKHCFDEFHYIPASLQWLDFFPTSNIEHPPLGKFLIAGGIKLFGNNPIGWRISSTIAGSFSILLIYQLSILLFEDLFLASIVAFYSLFNAWFYVFARVGMLDIFIAPFFLAGFYFGLSYLKNNKTNLHYYLSAIFFGLSVSTKWSAVFCYFPFFIYFFIKEKNSRLKNTFIFGLISLIAYYITFIPYLFVSSSAHITFSEIFISMPLKMIQLHKQVPGNHPYSSEWYTWPFLYRPVWFEFIKDLKDPNYFRGVVLLPNPFQMIIGLLAVLGLLFRIEKINEQSKLYLVTFYFSWLIWMISPRSLSFSYYFFPSAIFYSFLVPIFIKSFFDSKKTNQIMLGLTIISIIFFVFFFPILSGELSLMSERLKWHWFNSWI